MNTPSQAVGQSVERSAKIAKLLERRMRIAQDRFNERVAAASKKLPLSAPPALANPWALWIDNLSARDPFFILPIINVAIMWATQRLTPMAGMDPTQQKMMQLMPLVIGVTMIFFPAGLVLYWVTNGALGLLQQWWMLKRYGETSPAKA